MQQHIPDDLASEIAALAHSLDLDVEDAVRQALEHWIGTHQHSRLPDAPIIDDACVAPFEFPRNTMHPVSVHRTTSRLPDAVELR